MQLTLQSAPMVHTPGILAWAKNGYAFEADRENCVNTIETGYGLPRETCQRLLSGEIEYTVEGENVVFEDPHLTEEQFKEYRDGKNSGTDSDNQ